MKPSFYLFESLYPKRKHYTKGFRKLLKELNINPKNIYNSCTRDPYNNSDNTAWILFYGSNKEQLIIDKGKLNDIEFNGQKVFNVSGNGFGTGLSILLNYNKCYK